MREKTIKKSISVEGIGLHTGKMGKITLFPSSERSGIIFRNISVNKDVVACLENVSETRRGVTLKKDEVVVQTPEHLLAALYVKGVTNILIEYENEIPILDGSAKVFLDLIEKAGIIEQDMDRKVYKINNPIFLRENDKLLLALPYDKLRIRYLIDYPGTYIESEYYDFLFSEDRFERDISMAKTFGFYDEIEALRDVGLSLGGSLNNAIVVDKKRILGTLSTEREFVKHKIIDFLGDISLTNEFLIGDFILIKTGHKMHIEMAKKLKEMGGLYA